MLTLAALDIEHRYERRAGENDGCPLGSKCADILGFRQLSSTFGSVPTELSCPQLLHLYCEWIFCRGVGGSFHTVNSFLILVHSGKCLHDSPLTKVLLDILDTVIPKKMVAAKPKWF